MSHQTISFIKSFLRILGYIVIGGFFLFPVWTVAWLAGWFLLIVSELVGILEEVGHD